MKQSFNRKVVAVTPALDSHGQRETYLNNKTQETMYKTVITFEGGNSGVYSHSGESQDYFKIGEMADFVAEKTKYGIKIYKPSKKGGGGGNRPQGWVPKSPAEIKRDGLTFILGDVTKLVIADKLDVTDMTKKYNELVDAFFEQVDKVKDD